MREQEQRDQLPPSVPMVQDSSPDEVTASEGYDLLSPSEPATPSPPTRGRRVNLDGIVWAVILIWIGLVLLANGLGFLRVLGIRGFALSWNLPFRPAVWTLVFLGSAVAIGLDIAVRLALPAYRRNVLGYAILAIVSLSLGLGRLGLMWPLILLAVGAALLLKRRR